MSREASPLDRWLDRLASFSPNEIDLGLERVRDVLDRLALPRPGLVLHVAGTNGKGSSVELATRLLMSQGDRVGSYTSPHIHRYNERVAIDGVAVDDDEIVAGFERVEAVRRDQPLTYFEFGTLAALVVFAGRKVDSLVLEIGMGGRLDAVNAVEPDAGLITNVSLDHCDWLGDDIDTIAVEKAGIMRRGKPTVFAAPGPPASILRVAEESGAALVLAGRDYNWAKDGEDWRFEGRSRSIAGLSPPALAGEFQYTNAAGVLALLEAAGRLDGLERASLNQALSNLHLEGRMQRVERDRDWLFDVAHNPAAAGVLAATLGSGGEARRTVAIIGMRDDKDVEGIVAPLADVVDAWIAVAIDDSHATAVDELARRVANATGKGCLEAPSIARAIAAARERTSPGERVLVTGSFYLVGPALAALDL